MYSRCLVILFNKNNTYNINNVTKSIFYQRIFYLMQQKTPNIDRMTTYLLSNGDIATWSSQEIYEYAWDMGIRYLREDDLKPDFLTRRRRRKVSDLDMSSEYECGSLALTLVEA
jgi:hypothetical protein